MLPEQPQDQQYIKLNTNESPYLPSPAVVAAVSEHEVEKLRLYSDPCTDLKNGGGALGPAGSDHARQRQTRTSSSPLRGLLR